MQRGEFIKGLMALTVVPFLPMKLLGTITTRCAVDIWASLIEYARWSPSPHNVQPWRMHIVSETEAWLYYDNKRMLPATDPTSRFTIVGMGMFIECLSIAALHDGYKVTIEHSDEEMLNYKAIAPVLFAKLTLSKASNDTVAYNPELIKQRRTSRLHYDGRVIDSTIKDKLSAVAAAHGHLLQHSSDKEIVAYATALNRDTLFYDLDNEGTRQELSKLIRTTYREASEKKDGLWNKCMRFPGWLMHDFFFHYARFNSHFEKKKLGALYLQATHGTRNIAWISGDFNTRMECVNAGIMLQRLWLEMTKYNVYMHPFGSVITNPVAHTQFKKKIGFDENVQKPLWLLIRMGYSHVPPRSFRLDIKDILL